MAKQWIQKATASIKRRGTEGKCTPITKPGCTGKAKALAKTFKAMAKRRKGEDGITIKPKEKKIDYIALDKEVAQAEKNRNKSSYSNTRANKVIGKQ